MGVDLSKPLKIKDLEVKLGVDSSKPLKIQDLKKEGYSGVDANLATSLFEYKLIWKKHDDKTNEYKFIYEAPRYSVKDKVLFDYGYIAEKEFNEMINEEWFNLPGFLNFLGLEKESFYEMLLPYKVFEATCYHGVENIFGSTYYGFEIKE